MVTQQFCLWLAAIIFIILFIGYVFWYDHKEYIDESHWRILFEKAGLGKEIYNIKHDNDSWHFKGKNTCVGFSDQNVDCPYYENYCAGNNETYGSYEQQIAEIKVAIKNKGIHPDCPLIYEGGS